jgi:hypothetical protein
MRPTAFLSLVAVLAASLAAGCGTFANLQGRENAGPGCGTEKPRPFGGVSRDVRWSNEGYGVFLADVPLSLVGDLVTLPVVLLTSSEEDKGPKTQKEKDEAARKASLAQGIQNAQDRRPGAPGP